MKKLGEQWQEQRADGLHMYKTVKGRDCEGCAFSFCDNEFTEAHGCSRRYTGGCPFLGEDDLVAKDLGILNKDGCLPSPWGGYPKVIRVGKPNFVTYFNVSYVQKSEKGKGSLQVQVIGKTRQQAIDAWNRRA